MVVADLLRRLPEERREAFVLTQILGLSYAEAAQAADCPVGTIRSRVARARETLVEIWRGIEAESNVYHLPAGRAAGRGGEVDTPVARAR